MPLPLSKTSFPSVNDIKAARERLKNVAYHTLLHQNLNLSERYGAGIWLKREDLQVVRSYKLRGAYNKMSQLDSSQTTAGIVCASAGNHAQGVAYSCRLLQVKGRIYMPQPTPQQKIRQVEMFGKGTVEIKLVGDTFDDAYAAALQDAQENGSTFIHPFDDLDVIAGQGTVGLEILEDQQAPIDYLVLPIGGGGLASGLATVFKTLSPQTKIIGVEPEKAAAMQTAVQMGELVTLPHIDKFVDGAAVQRAGELTFPICRTLLDEIVTVPEGKVCSQILQLYNEEAIVVEPAGALSIAALDQLRDRIAGKQVVCIVSGSNNDITRTEEIKERSMLYEGLKHYFIIRFAQRAGALREFLNDVLGPEDDIVHFEYAKKHNREKGPALVGIEIANAAHLQELKARMKACNIRYEYLNNRPDLLQYLI